MKRFKTWTLALGLAVGLSGLAACGSSSDSDGAKADGGLTPVRLAFTGGAPTLQVHVAQTQGYFKKNGLDVKITEGADLPTWIASLDRQWDVAMTTAGIFVTGADKFDLVGVAGAQINKADYLGTPLVTRDPNIKNVGDLEGKRIGVATLTGSTPASLAYLVEKAGGDPKSLDLVQAPFAVQADQLKSGQVDAVVSAVPFASALAADPANRQILDVADAALRDIAPDQDTTAFLMFASSRDWADKNPKAAEALRKSLQQGLDYIASNKKAALDEMESWLGLPRAVIDAAPFPFSGSATVSEAQVEPTLKLYEKVGLIKAGEAPDLSDRFSD